MEKRGNGEEKGSKTERSHVGRPKSMVFRGGRKCKWNGLGAKGVEEQPREDKKYRNKRWSFQERRRRDGQEGK